MVLIMNWKNITIIGLCACLIVTLLLVLKNSDERQLEQFTHIQYSKLLYQNYEEPIIRYSESTIDLLEKIIENHEADISDIHTLIEQFNWLTMKQIEYSSFVEEYTQSGKTVVAPFISKKELLNLDYIFGFVYFDPMVALLKNIRNEATTGPIHIDGDLLHKFRVAHEIVNQHVSVYKQHLGGNFDPLELRTAIGIRLEIQLALSLQIPTLVTRSTEI